MATAAASNSLASKPATVQDVPLFPSPFLALSPTHSSPPHINATLTQQPWVDCNVVYKWNTVASISVRGQQCGNIASHGRRCRHRQAL